MLIPNSLLYLSWFTLIFLLNMGQMFLFPWTFSNFILYIVNILNDTFFKMLSSDVFLWNSVSSMVGSSPYILMFLEFSFIAFHRILNLFCVCAVHMTAKDLGWGFKTDLGTCPFAASCFPIFGPLFFSLHDKYELPPLTL